ncbi:MAG: TRAP transporter small permease [Syntrophus sp. (in: bacteria)]|nr:TRAP transporter small permease [Syntrophus sp. (in: bacteria)]
MRMPGTLKVPGIITGGYMSAFVSIIKRINIWMNTVAEAVLFIMMMLTVVDVILRLFGKPLVGTYELVAVAGAIVVAFAVPQTSWERGHIFVDFMIEKRSETVRNTIFICTRVVGIILWALLSYNLFKKGLHLYKTGEVSLTLHLPYYPAAYSLAFCFFIQCFSLVTDICRIFIKSGEQA